MPSFWLTFDVFWPHILTPIPTTNDFVSFKVISC